MRARIAVGVLFAGFAFGTNAFAQGQGTITDAPASYTIPAAHYDTSPAVNFIGVGPVAATDHLFENGWWYRIAGDTAEKFFPVPSSGNFPVATSYTVNWTNVDGRGFDASESGTVLNLGGPSGRVTLHMTVSLPAAAPGPITIDLFNFVDIDIGGVLANSATLTTPNSLMTLTAASGQTGEYQGIGATSFAVGTFGTATDPSTLLSNTVVDNFANTGLPFGPADFTAGYQWAGITLAPGTSRTVTAAFAINGPVPVELMNFGIE